MQDYVRAKIFRLPLARAPDGRLRVAQAPPSEQQPHVMVVMANEFPYYIDERVRHMNIWCTSPLPDDELERVIAAHLPCSQVCWVVNPVELQSVREVGGIILMMAQAPGNCPSTIGMHAVHHLPIAAT